MEKSVWILGQAGTWSGERMDSGSSCDDDWEKLMGRLDGMGESG